jgi:hypothetical protein
MEPKTIDPGALLSSAPLGLVGRVVVTLANGSKLTIDLDLAARGPAPAAAAPADRTPPPANGPPPKARHDWPNARPAAGHAATSAATGIPTTGKALFGWLKDRGQALSLDLVGQVKRWAAYQGVKARIVEWDRDQVDAAVAETFRYLETVGAPDREG